MKKRVIIIATFIIILLSGLIILYNNKPHYNMEVDGVKLAVTLDGNEVSSFPKDNDYYVNITCSHVIGEYLYDETEQTFKLTFKNIESGAKCSLAFTSNPDTLIDIVEEANDVYLEDGIPSGYTKIGQNKYTIQTPFYTSSFSSTVTSGTDEASAISWDSTNNYWITNPAESSKHYYFLITVGDAGYYQLCYKYLSGGIINRLYRYKNTTNMYSASYATADSSNDICIDYGYVETTDTIRIDQYIYSSVASLALYLKKSETVVSAGYRYEGANPNNYVWYNNELWRIIGSVPTKIDSGGTTITTDLVKIIRIYIIGSLVMNTSNTVSNWNETSLYTLLNSYYYGAQNATGSAYCFGNQNVSRSLCDYRFNGIMPNSYYGSMVKEVYWNTGVGNSSNSAEVLYSSEIENQTSSGFLGLMNASDYKFASRPKSSGYQAATNDWLHYAEQRIINFSDENQYSMIISTGNISKDYHNNGYGICPLVYLDPSIYVVSGDGSQATPYKIAWPSGS